MFFDFLNILALVTIFVGVVCCVDLIWRRRKKTTLSTDQKGKPKHPVIIDYARSFFPILLIVLLIRAFLVQPYRVPTGSLEPTILPGDMILVNQYDYGLKIPIWNQEIASIGQPQMGQIALFRWPVNPSVTFVKRVIGVPGDHISYINKVLYINGKQATQKFIKETQEVSDTSQTWPVKEYEEELAGAKHLIYIRSDRPVQNFKDLVVPPGEYLMMGDNRDDSDDSRSWGFVPENDFVGKAFLIWMSWDSVTHSIRWNRIGKALETPARQGTGT